MKLPTLCAAEGFCAQCIDPDTGPAWRKSVRTESRAKLPHACPRKLRDYDGPALIVPLLAGNYRGVLPKKPHEYRVTVALPHLNTPDLLPVVIDLLRLQTEPPYILVIDTGSPLDVHDKLRAEYEPSPDVEFHSIRSKGGLHGSDLVCHAMDLAFARCPTDLMFATHADAFLMRRNLLEEWAGKCTAATPLIGYGMSRRTLSPRWEQCMGHVAAMYHMPTMDKHGATWGLRRAANQFGEKRSQSQWPDTETTLSFVLLKAGVKPLFLGREINAPRQTTADFDHARSTTGHRAFQPRLAKSREGTLDAVVRDAKARAERWRADDAAAKAKPSNKPFHELWDLIHDATPATIADVLKQVRAALPCGDCRTDFATWPPPDTSSLPALRRWSWARHDATNERLKKPHRPTFAEVSRARGWGVDSQGIGIGGSASSGGTPSRLASETPATAKISNITSHTSSQKRKAPAAAQKPNFTAAPMARSFR